MGALPRWATLSLALPEANESWLTPFADGFFSMADEYDIELVGGDTVRGPLNICVQIIGEINRTGALRRDGARVGDTVWISGALGGAALALRHLQNKISLAQQAFGLISIMPSACTNHVHANRLQAGNVRSVRRNITYHPLPILPMSCGHHI